ncbi:MAG: amidohydrolase family protein [Chitinophagaceae bacterium]|nr:amidohydrolase family protein [Chitinophagaceae bacterium]
MQLLNVHIIGQEALKHIHIEDAKIKTVAADEKLLPFTANETRLIFEGAMAFPGLINSHDHLDFDSFQQTGNRIYNNYIDWGADIHKKNKEQINNVLKIPESLRIHWGVYKNLLAGVTTVVHHGKRLVIGNDLINIFQKCQTIHSVNRGKNWRFHLNKLRNRKQPVVIHIGEGTDDKSRLEIDQLIKWNYLKRSMVGVHGIALNEKQASSFKALVWCPASNDFLFGKTAAIDRLKHRTTILFGTDSTLTATWNIWDHLRLARDKKLLTDAELFDGLTVKPAEVWSLNDTGKLTGNQWADIVVAKPGNHQEKWEAFYNLNPEDILLIIHRGNIRLFDAGLMDQVKKNNIPIAGFSKIYISGTGKYVQGDVPGLMKEIREYHPGITFPFTTG